MTYGKALLEAHQYLLDNHPEVFVFGQGLWSPWYVGSSMTDLDKIYGTERIIDSPVSEAAVTGAGLGASIYGYKPIIVHPRIDFMILAVDQIINHAAKWRHMFGAHKNPAVTFRGIINRGGEQGAQHSQSLHSWFAHIPGLKVVMPYSVEDARDLFVASVLEENPVLFIDDRWLYDIESDIPSKPSLISLEDVCPKKIIEGSDITLVSSSYSTHLSKQAADELKKAGVSVELIDIRLINPIKYDNIIASVKKTKKLLVIDGGWTNCGLAGEIIAGVSEKISPSEFDVSPQRITLTDTPAPTSKVLEAIYYTKPADIVHKINEMIAI